MKCSLCGGACVNSDRGWFCYPCQRLSKGFSITSIKPATDSPFRNEAELVQAIRKALIGRGWLVYRIGQHRADRAGTDAGVPDLMCIRAGTPPYPPIIKLIEVKFGKNQLTPAQKKLTDLGAAFEARSIENALKICGEEK